MITPTASKAKNIVCATVTVLADVDITYHWAGRNLGGFRQVKPDSRHLSLTGSLRAYADHMARIVLTCREALMPRTQDAEERPDNPLHFLHLDNRSLHCPTFRHPCRSPGGQTPEFQRAADQLVRLANATCTTFMCAEKEPAHCHRSLIADYLSLRGMQIRHIVDIDKISDHRLNRFSRDGGEDLIYDRLLQRKLELNG